MGEVIDFFDAKVEQIRRSIREEIEASNSRTRKLLKTIDRVNSEIREERAKMNRKYFKTLEGGNS